MTRRWTKIGFTTICLLALCATYCFLAGDAEWRHRNRVSRILTTGNESEIDQLIDRCDHVRPIRGMSLQAMKYTWCYPIHLAARSSNKTALSKLLDVGVDVNTRDVNGDEVLCYLLDSDTHDEVVQADCLAILVNHRLNLEQRLPDTRDTRNPTALHVAASRLQSILVGELIRLGADVSALDADGNTPLHSALVNCRDDNSPSCITVVESLLNAGASRTCVNRNKDSPLSLVEKTNDPKLRQLILRVME